jgi:hypothetical protein
VIVVRRARRLRFAVAATLLSLLSLLAPPARAMTILPLDLPALTQQAGRIFVGRVERVESGHDAHGLPVTWTTFAVEQTVKGPDGAHVTLKQLGASLGPADARVLPHPGLPRYQPGESVVLFVHPESALGLTSPVGLGQGCFRIRDDHGAAVVENDVGNRNLGTAALAARALGAPSAPAPDMTPAPLPLETLLGRVRALVEGP